MLSPGESKPVSKPQIHSEILERYPALAKAKHSGKELSLLIVEDNRVNHRVVELLLGSIGCARIMPGMDWKLSRSMKTTAYDYLFHGCANAGVGWHSGDEKD